MADSFYFVDMISAENVLDLPLTCLIDLDQLSTEEDTQAFALLIPTSVGLRMFYYSGGNSPCLHGSDHIVWLKMSCVS